MRPKTEAIRGKTIPWKLRNDEEVEVLEWFNAQSVYGDSLRYLVQKEIAENGIRNLQHFIPQIRNIDSLRQISEVAASIMPPEVDRNNSTENLKNVNNSIEEEAALFSEKDVRIIPNSNSSAIGKVKVENIDMNSVNEIALQSGEKSERKASKKRFSTEDMQSYT